LRIDDIPVRALAHPVDLSCGSNSESTASVASRMALYKCDYYYYYYYSQTSQL